MVFSDLFFLLCFLPAFAVSYLLAGLLDRCGKGDGPVRRTGWRNAALVLFSLIFYAWGEPVYVFLMLGTVVMNYCAGLVVSGAGKGRKAALALGVAANLAVLGVFKYAGFFCGILRSFSLPVPDPGISLPIGISFYIFQSISYLADVYRREAAVQRRFADLLLYVSMFPQLIAGPIVRYGTVAEEIHSRRVSADDLREGAWRFVLGLGKKVILANQLSEVSGQFLGCGTDGLSSLGAPGAWLGLLAFTFQIYFDFSGYSDMAIGLGRCLGFHFKENFDHPYLCRSVTDFWRRWHMSLGSFFRDYVYIPMGGNRRRQPLNVLTVWFLTGMWHGASWNFILWGLYFGILVLLEKYTLLRWKKAPGLLLHLYSLLVVVLGWGLFYFEDFSQLGLFFRALWGGNGWAADFTVGAAFWNRFWLWAAALLLCFPLRGWLRERLSRLGTLHALLQALSAVAILALCVCLLVGATNNAFIYTRF